MEVSLLVLIIIARWLMPKGALTRDQLSALLLGQLGTASDIVDFFSINIIAEGLESKTFIYAIMTTWTWSLMQFPFVTTAVKNASDDHLDDEDEDEDKEEQHEGERTQAEIISRYDEQPNKKIKKKKKWYVVLARNLHIFVETEAWAIFVSLLMQDGPFFILRMVSVFGYNVVAYTNCFFAVKNFFVLTLQTYRLHSLYIERKAEKERERLAELERRRKAWRHAKFVDNLNGNHTIVSSNVIQEFYYY